MKINAVGELTSGAKIGIYNIGHTTAFTSGYNTYNANSKARDFFFSNDANKILSKNGNREQTFADGPTKAELNDTITEAEE